MVYLQRLIDPEGFLRVLGDFGVAKAGDLSEALIDLWNGEMARQQVEIVPEQRLTCCRLRATLGLLGK